MSGLRLATGPVTWGVDFADATGNPPWERVLDEISESGVGALELGPVGYLPEDSEVLAGELERRDLDAVGSFIFENLHDGGALEEVLAVAVRACRMIAGSGGSILVIIDRPSPDRAATAGRSSQATRLGEAQWAEMLVTISSVADIARSAGLTPAVHPHAGSYIEFEDEIERLVDDTELDICLDTGHFAYSGIDPAAGIRRYGSRLGHVHFKDVRAEVLARVAVDGLSFWDAVRAGVFCPLGQGAVDLPDVLQALDDVGYRGYATIEQDRVPGSGEPLDDLRASLGVLTEAGA